MNRRRVLLLTGGVVATAGCLGNDEPSEQPDLNIQSQQVGVVDTRPNEGRAYAEAVIENIGDARCGRVELTARFFDDSGSIIDENSIRLPTLDLKETWIARVGTSRDVNEIDNIELSGEYEISVADTPSGVSIVDTNFIIEETNMTSRVTAEIDNDRSEPLSTVSFAANLYNDEGEVVAGGETTEHNIPPGVISFFERTSWHSVHLHPFDAVTDHQVFLTEVRTSEKLQF